ncbi:MAG: nitrous oxide reductase family maturation protein NosD [Deltaproteobacteria bacterium]|nr:nitrous oxide reductase family maturation protein NosD [Deltaproteobacteria bacterium]MBW2414087.1 nitrous oxide reductase family maturation protein NosD [Deltaproteobacteria bacterium]
MRAAGAMLTALLSIAAAAPQPGPHSGREAAGACVRVPAGSDLQRRLDAAPAGAVFCLEAGDHAGPVHLGPGQTVRGPRQAVIRSTGEGTTVRLEHAGTALVGVTVDGSGGRFDLLDSAVRVEADGARVQDVHVRNAVFGILVEKSRRVEILGNRVTGAPGKALGMRGDGIRLWETRASRIEGNRVEDSRDLVVWYSPGNVIADNVIERGRYGTHFMYSHDNLVRGNRYVGNVVGIFTMYSRGIEVRDNLIADSGGAAGVGLGSKESGNLLVAGNRFIANTVGLYLDTSPLSIEEHNSFERNEFRLCDYAVVFHSSPRRNSFRGNIFRSNAVQVRVDGGGDALDTEWRENDFDDYAGYDLDGDGYGDLPYQLRSLSGDLEARMPALAFFRGSPALAAVEWVGHVVPIFQPRTLVIDPRPRVGEVADAR